MNKKIYIKSDITNDEYNWIVNTCSYIGVDTETTGLDPIVDRLCLIQIAANDKYFLVKYEKNKKYRNIENLLINNSIKKVFHHATFDVRFLIKNLEIQEINNIVCTKISFKILNGINEKSSLKSLLLSYLDIRISKDQQTSEWFKDNLSEEQLDYATNDVKYLVELWNALEKQLIDTGLLDYAQKCFDFLSTQAHLNNIGINNIFEY